MSAKFRVGDAVWYMWGDPVIRVCFGTVSAISPVDPSLAEVTANNGRVDSVKMYELRRDRRPCKHCGCMAFYHHHYRCLFSPGSFEEWADRYTYTH